MRVLLIVALIVGAILIAPAPDDAASPDLSDDAGVSFSAECDVNDHAVHVEPDTAAARQAAEHMCRVTGDAIDTAPWPDGLVPVPLDSVTGGRR